MKLRVGRVGSASSNPSNGVGAAGNGGLAPNPSQKRQDHIFAAQQLLVVGGLCLFLLASAAFRQWYALGMFAIWITLTLLAMRLGDHFIKSRQDEVNERFNELLDEDPPPE